MDDIQGECAKFGKILDVKIPRPTSGNRQSAGVGKIFVKFDSVKSATDALKALAGRKFSDRTVVTTYFSEVSFFLFVELIPLFLTSVCRKTLM